MPEPTQRGARLVVSFELADVRKAEGLYLPELTVEELLEAIKEYTLSGCKRTRDYDEDISNPSLLVVDFAVAGAAAKAISALYAELKARNKELEVKNQDLEVRIDRLKVGPPAPKARATDPEDDIPF